MSWITAIFYYLVFVLLWQHPYILVLAVLLYFFWDRIPSPAEFFRRQRRLGRLRREVAVNPYDATARRDLGMVLLEKGSPREALENFLEALKKDDSAEIHHFVGLSYLRSGEPANAVEHLERAARLDHRLRYGEPHLHLGEAYLELKRPEDALKSLDTFLSINSTSIEGLYGRARALLELGRKDEARKAIEDGIKYHKANPGFRRRRDWRWYVKLKGVKGRG